MPSPNRVMVGDMSVATQDGPGWFTLPFADKGDTQSWEWHAYFTQLATSFASIRQQLQFLPGFVSSVERMGTAQTARGVGYLVAIDEPTKLNTNVFRFKLTYAGLPGVNGVRYEYGSRIYSRQFTANSAEYDWDKPPPSAEVFEFPLECQGYTKFEYFIGFEPPPIIAPRVTAFMNTYVYTPNAAAWPPDYSAPVVAESSKVGIYKGGIFQRVTPYIQWPSTATST